MGDLFDSSAAEVERLKREQLAAMAQQGRAALGAVDQNAAALATSQQQAADQMLAGAQQRGAPASAQAALTSYARQPQELAAGNMANLRGIAETDMARQSKANDYYMGQASAAVPAIRASSEAQIARMRAEIDARKKAAEDAKDPLAGLSQWEMNAIASGAAENVKGQQGGALVAERQARDQQIAQWEAERAAVDQQIAASQSHMQRPANIPPSVWQANREDFARDAVDPKLIQKKHQLDANIATAKTRQATIDKQVAPGTEANPDLYAGAKGKTLGMMPPLPPDYQLKREALMSIGVPAAQAEGMFMPPTAGEQLTTAKDQDALDYYSQTGATSPAGAASNARGADYLTGANRVLRTDEVIQQLGIDPKRVDEMRGHQTVVKEEVTDADGNVVLAKGDKGTPYQDAITTAEAAKKRGDTIETVNADLKTYYVEHYGHDFPEMRRLVTEMYRAVLAGE